MAQFQVNFYPKGYFSTISLYGNFMARQNDNVTLKILRQHCSPNFGGSPNNEGNKVPMLVEATLQVDTQIFMKSVPLNYFWILFSLPYLCYSFR